MQHVERKIIEHLLQTKQLILAYNSLVSWDSRQVYLGVTCQAGRCIGAIFLDMLVIRYLECNTGLRIGHKDQARTVGRFSKAWRTPGLRAPIRLDCDLHCGRYLRHSIDY